MENLHVAVDEDVVIDFRPGATVRVTSHMHEALSRMRAALIATAQAGATTSYGSLMEATGKPYLPQGLGRVLDVLTVECARRGEPSLAALVVRRAEREVGDGYTGDARVERSACWRYWGPHEPGGDDRDGERHPGDVGRVPVPDESAAQRHVKWSVGGLQDYGFEGFVRFADLPDTDVPDGPGVYVVVRSATDVPTFLHESPAGWFKGRNPAVSGARLVTKWVDGASVIYIGKATPGMGNRRGLRKRLNEYRRFGTGVPVGHWGGRFVWQLGDHETLTVAWKVLDDQDATEVEDQLIRDFVSHHGTLPFANVRHERT